MFIFWIFAAVAALFFIRWLVEHEKSDRSVDGISSVSSESALDILKKRYARGEIDREQYESMKRDLQD